MPLTSAPIRHAIAALLFVAGGLLGPTAAPAPTFAQSPDSPAEASERAADFEIPAGWFFTQALPGREETLGFAVQDGHGARFWTEFQARGDVATLGYPISRRFAWHAGQVQAFQGGVLAWDAEQRTFDLLPLAALPDGTLPLEAIQPEAPPRVAGEAAQRPWSGWYWPSTDGLGPTLFGPGSPLVRYDRLVEQVSGENPRTHEWERREMYFPGVDWAGHCNGIAAAALLEPEPTEPRDVLGITFSVADLKGLFTKYHFADSAAWSFGHDGTLDPADFHRALLTWLGGEAKGFVVTFDLGRGEVWSYPAYRFESAWSPDPERPDRWRVVATVWMADVEVPSGFVGLRPYPSAAGQRFEYALEGDPWDPSAGEWTGPSARGGFGRPGRVWYPNPLVRNVDREYASSGLSRDWIEAIVNPELLAVMAPEATGDVLAEPDPDAASSPPRGAGAAHSPPLPEASSGALDADEAEPAATPDDRRTPVGQEESGAPAAPASADAAPPRSAGEASSRSAPSAADEAPVPAPGTAPRQPIPAAEPRP